VGGSTIRAMDVVAVVLALAMFVVIYALILGIERI
jgi:hypothetical protein